LLLGYGSPPVIATHCPRPLRKGGPKAFEWGLQVATCEVETGEGACPLPVSPSPNGDIPTVHFMEAIPEKNHARLPTGYLHALPPPLGAGNDCRERSERQEFKHRRCV